MSLRYGAARTLATVGGIEVVVSLHGRPKAAGACLGCQLHDPETGRFIAEADWVPLRTVDEQDATMAVTLPPETGSYDLYVGVRDEERGWDYRQGGPFVLVPADVAGGQVRVGAARVTTLGRERRRRLPRALGRALTRPFVTVWQNRGLIRAMTRREVLARYRGSSFDVLWTVLNPLLLMATYFFVFGVVLGARLPGDRTRTGFALYFLAGMLPWLAFSEAVGRAPSTLLEYRGLVKKLVFPVETLTVNQVLASLVTEGVALVLFLGALLLTRGGVPTTALLLPLLIVPQVLLTCGLCWTLAALGAYVRDLGQVIGFLLTLLFFLTPICYPDVAVPPTVSAVLRFNPIYAVVRGYRTLLLDGSLLSARDLLRLWALGFGMAVLGCAWFYRLRRTFADVL